MQAMHESLVDISQMFHKRMEEFEDRLKCNPNPGTSTSGIVTEFEVFKEFVVKSLNALQRQMDLLSKEVDRMDMQGRRKMLLLHGVPEDRSESTASVVTRIFTSQLKLGEFKEIELERCHRMGQSTIAGKPRPILLKLKDSSTRDKAWSSKAGLKGSGVTLSEFLTKARHSAFMLARQRFGITNCWTRDGSIVIVGADGVRHRITAADELAKIPSNEGSKPPKAPPNRGTAGQQPKPRRACTSRKQ